MTSHDITIVSDSDKQPYLRAHKLQNTSNFGVNYVFRDLKSNSLMFDLDNYY